MTLQDVVIVGSGPNGLAAGVALARAGLDVTVLERASTIGGGTRTSELTLPGFRHDVCSSVHPMAFTSRFFREFQIERRVELLLGDISYAQPLDGARAALAYHDLERTSEGLGVDRRAWNALMRPLVDHVEGIADFTLSQLLRIPADPVTAVRFGLRVLEQGTPVWNARFRGDEAPALLAGLSAHSIGQMPRLSTSGAGLFLGALAHAGGWPIPRGGSQTIADAMAADIRAHGGRIETDVDVVSRADLPPARATLFDVSPRALLKIFGDDVPARYRRALERFRFGDAVAKIDFALDGEVPWSNPELRAAPTLHLGGTRQEVAAAEASVARGEHADRPYVLVNQPSVLDDSRAPAGKHVLWAYTHVPHGSTRDVSETIIRQIERFAPGFRDRILAQHYSSPASLEQYNPNYVGGDISAGAMTLAQLVKRPVVSRDPWRTPMPGVFLSSSSTPPGTGVHGMAGYWAARSALRHVFGSAMPALGLDS